MGTTSDFSLRPETDLDGCEKCEKSANDGGLHACTDKYPPVGHATASDPHNGGNGPTPFRSDIQDAYAELALRDDLSIPPNLDRRHEVCAQCGQPGGTEWDYRGHKVRLHERCEQSWIDNFEASHGGDQAS